jgi:hypothetical protein
MIKPKHQLNHAKTVHVLSMEVSGYQSVLFRLGFLPQLHRQTHNKPQNLSNCLVNKSTFKSNVRPYEFLFAPFESFVSTKKGLAARTGQTIKMIFFLTGAASMNHFVLEIDAADACRTKRLSSSIAFLFSTEQSTRGLTV